MTPGRGRTLFLLIFFMLTAGRAFGQVTEGADIIVSIVEPLGLGKEDDMNFGQVAPGYEPGTVLLKPDGSRIQGGGVSLPSTPGTVAAAAFQVTGAPGFSYSVTLPPGSVTVSNGNQTMNVSEFTSEPAGTGLLGPDGQQLLKIGATLSVGAGQETGLYNSMAEFTVTVNYN